MEKLLKALLVLLLATVTLAFSSFGPGGVKEINTVRQKLAKVTGIKFPRLIEDETLNREAKTMERAMCEDIRAPPNRRFFLNGFGRTADGNRTFYPEVFEYGLYLAVGLTPSEARIPKDLLAVSQIAKSYLEPKMNESDFMMGPLELFNPEQVAAGCSINFGWSGVCNQTVPPEFGLGLNQRFTARFLCVVGDSGTFKDAKKILTVLPQVIEEIEESEIDRRG